jgi:hypothetical protein
MDKIPMMTEKKKKVDMHIQTATKILSEIKRRSIDKLQDFEDELMTSGRLSGQNKVEIMNYLRQESDKQEIFNDKMRLLFISIMCGSDIAEIRQMIDIIKELHKDRYDDEFVESIMKKRADIETSTQ